MEANPKAKSYAGLRRIGDPKKGTAIWTKVAEDKVDAKLAERAEQRRAEDAISRQQGIERLREKEPEAEPAPNVTPRNAVPQNQVVDASAHSTSQKQVNEKLEAVNENLGKIDTRLKNIETASGGSCCTVA